MFNLSHETASLSRLQKSFLRWEVQLLTFIVVLIVLGQLARVWAPMAWVASALLFGLYLIGVIAFLLLAALTPRPYPRHPKILIVRLQQLAKGIWAALMLVLSALLGATLSADLLSYGTDDFFGFFTEVFAPYYLNTVLSFALWGGMLIYMMLTATDLLVARESARTEARNKGLNLLAERLGYNTQAEWPYGVILLGSIWKNLTGGAVRLWLLGYLVTPLIGVLTYSAIEQLPF